jgi:hypothetical protein
MHMSAPHANSSPDRKGSRYAKRGDRDTLGCDGDALVHGMKI